MDDTNSRRRLNTVQLASLINKPPHVFMGCTAVELNVLAALSILMFIVASIFSGLLLQKFGFAMGTGALFAFLAFYSMTKLLSQIKSTKPEGHYMLLIFKLRACVFSSSDLITRSGNWSVSRQLRGGSCRI
jgi:conjugative transfer region protein (TIGR03750 family)